MACRGLALAFCLLPFKPYTKPFRESEAIRSSRWRACRKCRQGHGLCAACRQPACSMPASCAHPLRSVLKMSTESWPARSMPAGCAQHAGIMRASVAQRAENVDRVVAARSMPAACAQHAGTMRASVAQRAENVESRGLRAACAQHAGSLRTACRQHARIRCAAC